MSMYIYCICFFSVEFADGPCKDNQILTNTYSCSKMQRSFIPIILSLQIGALLYQLVYYFKAPGLKNK